MQITIPASADGTAGATSVLDLEPLIGMARQCRADAIRLLPPTGADDLPNGAALLAMKQRLERAELGVTAGFWRAPADADVEDPGWQTANLFEAKALLAALGEAEVGPLTVMWDAPLRDASHRAALHRFLENLLEESQRAGVPVALRSGLPLRERDLLLRTFETPFLGLCLDARVKAPEGLGDRLFSACLDFSAKDGHREGLVRLIRSLKMAQFVGPLHVLGPDQPLAFAYAVGWVRGVLEDR